jgi:hypothetical protein
MVSAAERVDKREPLSRLNARRDQLVNALADIPEPVFRRPLIARWSVRDLLGHLVAHEQRALAEIAVARRGERLAIDHTGTDAFNAGAAFAWTPFGREEALAAWERSYRSVVAAVEALSETDFVAGSALEQALGDTVD